MLNIETFYIYVIIERAIQRQKNPKILNSSNRKLFLNELNWRDPSCGWAVLVNFLVCVVVIASDTYTQTL
jgi:hypothetical protein